MSRSTPLFSRLFAAILVILVTASPFSGIAQEFESEAERPKFADDELSRQLESKASRGGLLRATAIGQLARIGNWPAVDRWMIELGKSDQADQLAAWSTEIGADMLLRISLEDSLSDEARAALEKLLTKAKGENEDEGQLEAAIEAMINGDVNTRLGAQRRLLKGGRATTRVLVKTLASGKYRVQEDGLIELLSVVDSQGASALQQISLYGNDTSRSHALRAFAKMVGSTEARDSLVSAAVAANAVDDERSVAEVALQSSTGFDVTEASDFLYQQLLSVRRIAKRTQRTSAVRTLWSIDESGAGASPSDSTEFYSAYRDAYDAAQRLNRVGSLSIAMRREVLAAELEYQLIVDPDWGSDDQVIVLVSRFPEIQDPEFVSSVLRNERALGNEASSIGLLRVIASSAAAGSESAFLFPTQGAFSPLVDSTLDPFPRVRFEAATAIVRMIGDGEPRFPGASHFAATLSEMKRLGSVPKAILIETRPELAISLEQVLSQLGVDVFPVTSTKAAESFIARDGDIALILSKVQLPDSTAREMIDRIRRTPRGRNAPIVLYADTDTVDSSREIAELEMQARRWELPGVPKTILVDLPGSPIAFAPLTQELEMIRRLPAMTVVDRTQYRRIAESFLLKP